MIYIYCNNINDATAIYQVIGILRRSPKCHGNPVDLKWQVLPMWHWSGIDPNIQIEAFDIYIVNWYAHFSTYIFYEKEARCYINGNKTRIIFLL